ncbi:MAG TPA: sigma-70 family RNA polymerase sigma factor [Planctomycetaceae bacterium]|nr:sigma-70 family RNA polymerase sigma factor [Planctomycetaceae bacterium]
MPEWDEIVDRHARLVFGVAYRILGSVHDAEDIAQDAFRETFELARRGKVTDWRGCLCRIAAFRAIDAVRRRRKFSQLDLQQASPALNPAAEIEARELGERLRSSLPLLPRQAAVVFTMMFFEQLSRQEVAAALGMTPQAVSVALFKARKRLQEILQVDPDRVDQQNEVCHESEP